MFKKSVAIRAGRADTSLVWPSGKSFCKQPNRPCPFPYATLTSASSIENYLYDIQVGVFDVSNASSFQVEEIEEGKINHVYKVTVATKDISTQYLLLKFAPPYVKSVGESFKLSQERMNVEAAVMKLLGNVCPEHVPAFVFYDKDNSVLAMDFLHSPYLKVVSGLHDYQLTYPKFAEQLGAMLACISVKTRRDYIGQEQYEKNLVRFKNTDIVTANERVVLTDPMDPTCPTNYTSTCSSCRQAFQEFRSSQTSRQALQELLHSYRHDKHVLIHNDLHTGNLLATQDNLACIDWEFATYGPAAFDIGNLLGVLALGLITIRAAADQASNLKSTDGEEVGSQESREAYMKTAAWLASVIPDVWRQYVSQYETLCAAHGLQPWCGSVSSVGPARDRHVLLRDVLGFTAFSIFRLTAGLHSYPGYGRLADSSHDAARLQAVCLARDLLELRASADNESSMLERLDGMLRRLML